MEAATPMFFTENSLHISIRPESFHRVQLQGMQVEWVGKVTLEQPNPPGYQRVTDCPHIQNYIFKKIKSHSK